jgi:hypothetical protein
MIFVAKPLGMVRIVAVPPGEAPDWVRQKWVGLELPVHSRPRPFRGFGVLTGPRTFLRSLWAILSGQGETIFGYAIDAAAALAALQRSSPEAAQWWRDNAPRHMQPGRCLLFHATVCELL